MALSRSLRMLCAATACTLALPAGAAGVLFGVVQGSGESAVGLILAMRCPSFDAEEGRGGAVFRQRSQNFAESTDLVLVEFPFTTVG